MGWHTVQNRRCDLPIAFHKSNISFFHSFIHRRSSPWQVPSYNYNTCVCFLALKCLPPIIYIIHSKSMWARQPILIFSIISDLEQKIKNISASTRVYTHFHEQAQTQLKTQTQHPSMHIHTQQARTQLQIHMHTYFNITSAKYSHSISINSYNIIPSHLVLYYFILYHHIPSHFHKLQFYILPHYHYS